jgi:hypothetical protein
MVGSAMTSCQWSIGTWPVMMVDPQQRAKLVRQLREQDRP